MILFPVVAVVLFMWPRFVLYFFAAPFFGAILGAFCWAMAMFASGCTMSLSSVGIWVVSGMVVSTVYAIFWANREGI